VETAAEYEGVSVSDKLSIVITTHGEGRDLPGILSSIHNQRQYRSGTSTRGEPYNYEAGPYFTKPNIEVIISWDGKPDPDFCQAMHVKPFFKGMDWKIIENEKAEPSCCGHNTRGPGIEAATGDWILLTNSDNWLMPGLYHSLVQCFLPQYGLIYFDLVSNLWQWQARKTEISWGAIDLTAVCVRSRFAKEVGFSGREYDADWPFINACSKLVHKSGLRQLHIGEILAVHA
jgi:hypothetical protein